MNHRGKNRGRRKRRTGRAKRPNRTNKNRFLGAIAIWAVISIGVLAVGILKQADDRKKPPELLVEYMNHISNGEYEAMYEMLDVPMSGNITKEDFIQRNLAIYEGIEARNLIIEVLTYDEEYLRLTYQTTLDTAAGKIQFENEVFFVEREDGYQLVWDDSLIFSQLEKADKVRVSTTQAKRGEICDRKGRLLAGEGVASSVGIVPGKLEERESAILKIAELLELEPETFEKKLSAKWVKDDSFVPIKTIPKLDETEPLALEMEEETMAEWELQAQLLEIPGVMISDTAVREYPIGEATAHLIGYVQNVTAEDLEEHVGEGYTANSVIGKSGMESLYEKELKGEDGCRIYIVDADSQEKEELAYKAVRHGKNVQLTIDAKLQTALYEQLKEDKSCSVAINQYTGEVLALVSTPAYDNNDFILGMSGEQWKLLNENENKPLYNRFRQVWCPGSTFKPITAAIGLEAGAFQLTEDFGSEGLSWQKDSSWGSYHVTTLHEYAPVTLENALIYSDNIYFAKAALKIGADTMEASLTKLGFGAQMPFEIKMQQSQYSNTEGIETEIQLADSGYGQGEVLINPLHMACIYSAFCNEGNIIKPYLAYKQEAEGEYWVEGAFSKEVAGTVLEGTKKVVNNQNGTGYAARRDDVMLAGKTGTAEIKVSKEDTSGTELGWFAIFTAEETVENPIMLIIMVEDVKGRGGSGYVVEKSRKVLEQWFAPNER